MAYSTVHPNSGTCIFLTFWSIQTADNLQRIHYTDQNDQIDIRSCDYHATKMAAEERAFKKTVRMIIPAGL